MFLRLYSQYQQLQANNAELQLAASVFDSQQGMIITDMNNIIIRVNQAFTDMTGYSKDEAIGKNPSFLKSGRHDSDFYRGVWQSIKQSGAWQGEIWDRRKNGEIYPQWLTITSVKTNSILTHYSILSFR